MNEKEVVRRTPFDKRKVCILLVMAVAILGVCIVAFAEREDAGIPSLDGYEKNSIWIT